MAPVHSWKFYSTALICSLFLTACGKPKSTPIKPSATPNSTIQTQKPAERPPLPSDLELEKMIDITQDAKTDEVTDQVADEDENPIPAEIFIPEIPAAGVKPKTPSKPISKPAAPPKKETPQVPEKDVSQKSQEPKGQAINYPNRGSLHHAASLLERRESFGSESPFEISKRTVDQKRFFATDDLIDFIEFMANYFQSFRPGHKLLISDLSKESGGPVCCSSKKGKEGQSQLSHQSHQNGLDADIAYLTMEEKDKFFRLSFATVKKSVDLDSQMKLFKQMQKSKLVDFILVHPSLKKELCIEAYKNGSLDDSSTDQETIDTLKILIPDQSHSDHFHVRIKCDSKVHPKCLARLRNQSGHGCVVKQNVVSK